VHYNECGNEVTLVKFFSGEPSSETE